MTPPRKEGRKEEALLIFESLPDQIALDTLDPRTRVSHDRPRNSQFRGTFFQMGRLHATKHLFCLARMCTQSVRHSTPKMQPQNTARCEKLRLFI